jgi:hypothetical protein
MFFNFNRAQVLCPAIGKKVHVILALIELKRGVRKDQKDVVQKSINYIKELEAAVGRLQAPAPIVVDQIIDNPSSSSAERVTRGLIDRFLGR